MKQVHRTNQPLIPVGVGAAVAIGAATGVAHADVTVFTDYGAWSAAIGGSDVTIGFNIGQLGPLSDQYAHLGVHFVPGFTFAAPSSNAPDGWFAQTAFLNQMVIDYDVSQSALAVKITNGFTAKLYLDGAFVLETPYISPGAFRGFTLGKGLQFDRAILAQGPGVGYAIDDLYVATPIPSAGALPLIVAAFLAHGRRRRS